MKYDSISCYHIMVIVKTIKSISWEIDEAAPVRYIVGQC